MFSDALPTLKLSKLAIRSSEYLHSNAAEQGLGYSRQSPVLTLEIIGESEKRNTKRLKLLKNVVVYI